MNLFHKVISLLKKEPVQELAYCKIYLRNKKKKKDTLLFCKIVETPEQLDLEINSLKEEYPEYECYGVKIGFSDWPVEDDWND